MKIKYKNLEVLKEKVTVGYSTCCANDKEIEIEYNGNLYKVSLYVNGRYACVMVGDTIVVDGDAIEMEYVKNELFNRELE